MKKYPLFISTMLCALATAVVVSQFRLQLVAAQWEPQFYHITLTAVNCRAYATGYLTREGHTIYPGWELKATDGTCIDMARSDIGPIDGWMFGIEADWDKDGYWEYKDTIEEGPFTVPHAWRKVYLIGEHEVILTVTKFEWGVGGFVVPVDKFGLLAPYIGVASTILVATVATAVYVKRVKRKEEKQ